MLNIFPFFLALYEFTLYLSNDMYLPAFPTILAQFHTSERIVQQTLTSWLLGDGLLQIIFGPLSDRIGRRPIIIWAGIIFIITCIGCITVKNIYIFILIRFIQGAAVCSVAVAGYAAIHESFEDKKAVELIALMSIISISAPMLGPLIGGYIVTHYPWQIIFVVVTIFAVISLIGLYMTMPETLKNKNPLPMTFRNLWNEYYEIFYNKDFMIYSIISGLYFAGTISWITISPFYLIIQKSFTPEEFGLAQMPALGGFIIGAQIMRVLSRKFTLMQLVKLGIGWGFVAAVLICISLLYENLNVLLVIAGMGIYGTGFGIVSAPVCRLAFNGVIGGRGVVNAVYCSCMLLIGSLISFLIGWFGGGVRDIYLFSLSICVTTSLNALLYSYQSRNMSAVNS